GPVGAPVVAELRCQCLQTLQGIHLRNIQNVQVTPSGPHCARTEVVATLKEDGGVSQPEAPLGKRMIQKMLTSELCLSSAPGTSAAGHRHLQGICKPRV
uniref:Chemokine interleukin-8-like domain-containing protein n=1 Tax=Canis lupus familiaris TaxID=9615 RepID=A0A8P0PJ56_CANLF